MATVAAAEYPSRITVHQKVTSGCPADAPALRAPKAMRAKTIQMAPTTYPKMRDMEMGSLKGGEEGFFVFPNNSNILG
jgi:hypothetical protein